MPDLATLSATQQRMAAQLEAVGALQALVASAAAELGQGGGVGGSGGRGPAGGGAGGGPLLAVAGLPPAAGGGAFGATPLLHLVYKHCGRQQYVASPFSAPLVAGGMQQVRGRGPRRWRAGNAAVPAGSVLRTDLARSPAPHPPHPRAQPLIVAYSQLRAAMFEGSAGGAGPLQRLRCEARPRFVLLGAGGWGVHPVGGRDMRGATRLVCGAAVPVLVAVIQHTRQLACACALTLAPLPSAHPPPPPPRLS